MRPGTYALDLYRGDSYAWRFTLWLDAARTIPADITGGSARAQVRSSPGGTLRMDLDCTVDAPQWVDMELSAEAWETWPCRLRKGDWDLEVTTFDGQVLTILAGPVAVTLDVTMPVTATVP